MTRCGEGRGAEGVRKDSGRRRGWVEWMLLVTLAAAPAIPAQATTYSVFPAHANDARSAVSQPTGRHVTLVLNDSTVEYVIGQLVQQAHLQATYVDAPALRKRVKVHIVDMEVMDAIASVLHGTGLVARLATDGETVIVRQGGLVARIQSGTIAGRVTDSTTGAGLGGAQVRVEGVTRVTAVTADSGTFTLRNVPVGDQVLQVRLFGYRPVSRMVTVVDGERTTVRIAMAPVPTVLSGVVTTATGVQRKVEVGNDITTLNVDSIMQVAPVSSVTDLLETRVPGLTVMHSSGEPGAPSRLRLRGIGSISGNNDPVIIIDGVRAYSNQSDPRNNNLAPSKPTTTTNISTGQAGQLNQHTEASPSPIDQIDPNSIETIDVFKGPSASAMYGSDAANGVIVITTKHGRAGPTHWSLNLGQGVNWIPGNWPDNFYRFTINTINSQGPVCNWYVTTCLLPPDSVREFQALNDSRYTVLSHGRDQTASLTVTGGVPTLQYSLSGSGTAQIGNLKLPLTEQKHYESVYGPIPGWMVRPDNYSTWGGSGSLTALPYQTFRATLQSSLFNSNQQTSSLNTAIPQLEGLYISGGYVTNFKGTLLPLATTPLVNDYVNRVTAAAVTTDNNLTLSWQPRPWLPLTLTGGVQTTERTDRSYIPWGINAAGPGGNSGCIDSSCNDTNGYYGLGRGVSTNQTLAAGTTIPLLRQHLMLALGGNTFGGTTNDFRAYTDQLAPGVSAPSSFTDQTCAVSTTCGASQGSTSGSTYGWYVEPRLNVNSRFFVAPGFRLDGGSGGTHSTTTGGAAGGLSAFPKIDFSYLAVDRQGSRPMWGFLTLLRPRVAFGLAGTQPAPEDRLRLFNVGAFTTLSPGGENNLVQSGQCANGSVLLNGVNTPAVCLNTLGNTQLHPERSSELEGGFETMLWNGRFTTTFTRYNKTRKDAIISIPVAPSVSGMGGASFFIAENIGEVRNTGTELTLNATVLESRALTWDIGANLSNNNNLLVHLNPGQAPNYNLGLVPGYPLGGKWIKPILYFADKNNNQIIESNEIVVGDSLVFQGQPNPKYQLNVNTGMHLLGGRMGVYATFAYQNGLTQTNDAALQSASFLMVGNNPSTPLSYQAAVRATCSDLSSGVCPSTQNTTNYGLLQTVNTFRFNALSVNYELPRTVSSWFRVPRASVVLQGSNLALHSNYRGRDPNVNAFSTVSSVDQTADQGQIPEPRVWWLKLTLGN